MVLKSTPFLLIFVLLLFLASCTESVSDQMPNLDASIDELEFNKHIRLTAPKEINTYKPGQAVILEVQNLSKKVWNYNITKDILIYKYENEGWRKVLDNTINVGATELTLDPSDKDIVSVTPNISLDQSTWLRIIILFHEQSLEKNGKSNGAFVDVQLSP